MFCVDNGFKFLVMLHKPYEEFPEQVLVLNNVNKLRMNLFGERETLHLRKAVQYAAALPMTREKDLKRALQQMPADLVWR